MGHPSTLEEWIRDVMEGRQLNGCMWDPAARSTKAGRRRFTLISIRAPGVMKFLFERVMIFISRAK